MYPHPESCTRAEFDALYQRYRHRVWATANARLANADLALDVAQEVFLRLWREWEAGRAVLNPKAWLMRVAHNLAEDCAKSAFRRHGTHETWTLGQARGRDPGPLEQAERRELCSNVRQALAALRLPDREILRLRYGNACPVAEIAAALQITVPAATMRLWQARRRLALYLEDYRPLPTPARKVRGRRAGRRIHQISG
jgi:RNA polymerase sigma-70 factor (ECF subfamily)